MRRLVACAVLALAQGCATFSTEPGDELRVVHPVTWRELAPLDLQEMCRDWTAGLRGCVVSRPEGDHIYTLPVCR